LPMEYKYSPTTVVRSTTLKCVTLLRANSITDKFPRQVERVMDIMYNIDLNNTLDLPHTMEYYVRHASTRK